MAQKRTCIICGRQYEYCGNCDKSEQNETWRNIYDSQECRSIFKICSGFKNAKLTKESAQKSLAEITIPVGVLPGYQKIINEINFVEQPVIESEPIAEDIPIEEEIQKTARRRRKQYQIL